MNFVFLIILLSSSNGLAQACINTEHWVRAYQRSSYFRADGTFVKAAQVTAHCRLNSESYTVWKEKLKVGRPEAWPHRDELATPWTINDEEKLIEALSELPKNLWSEKIKGIYRLKKSKDFPNPASSADGVIVLYDTAFRGENKKRTLARFLAHEFAHQKYLDLSDDDRESYHMVTNWMVGKSKSTGRNIYVSRKEGYVTEDGRLSPEEDFANNIEFFLFESALLKS